MRRALFAWCPVVGVAAHFEGVSWKSIDLEKNLFICTLFTDRAWKSCRGSTLLGIFCPLQGFPARILTSPSSWMDVHALHWRRSSESVSLLQQRVPVSSNWMRRFRRFRLLIDPVPGPSAWLYRRITGPILCQDWRCDIISKAQDRASLPHLVARWYVAWRWPSQVGKTPLTWPVFSPTSLFLCRSLLMVNQLRSSSIHGKSP
jgi:hypothetical protein